ncbi:MAG TPA: TIGR03435 family protein [Terracidiphilus sp.]|nr:TIGR03435 family protein [Terracidiphilus sp.]
MFARRPNRDGEVSLRAAVLIACAVAATFCAVHAAQVWAQSSAAAAWEQAAGGKQEFEVASVREDKASGRSSSNFSLDNGNAYFAIGKGDVMAPRGTLFMAKNLPLLRYVIFAYKLDGTQELALRFDFWQGLEERVPAWVKNDRFDIDARAPGDATKDQMRMMMQSLLAERFKLAVSWETREVPVYAMVLEKPGNLGPQLVQHPSSDNCAATALPDAPGKSVPAAQPASPLPIPCGMIAHLPPDAPGAHRFGGRDVTLAMLAESLPPQTGLVTLPRPVIDKTGLTGKFDFSMEWTPEDTSEVDNHESGGTFREALKKQLGLKLEPQKGPVEVLVIDHVEQPSPN